MHLQLSRNFTLEEFTYSRIAIEQGLENIPNPQALLALKNLTGYLLQPLRERYGKTIAITSGYRNEAVNLLAGGVKNSQHTKGEAADCYITEGPEGLLGILQASGLAFDQAIVYRRKKFLHLSYREGFNRQQVLYK
ncbi:peptidase M15 [Parabacteroides sp. TM07-1AC]|uniref:D-Ala-D-Ala carboxypeptidase family metallohydrolase n=1 Tax=Parabacteroides sp. TM07-1AC TaxID=2292363 RepID=UPI000EFF2D12|nr:D-Ala-D-Ala carboxypeptidase family metallohydrolase [Parabacteroides sp. TM07-1AC]RHU28123.1 peptidase M15 [Parabacteroides sp. TM07-1AC]